MTKARDMAVTDRLSYIERVEDGFNHLVYGTPLKYSDTPEIFADLLDTIKHRNEMTYSLYAWDVITRVAEDNNYGNASK